MPVSLEGLAYPVSTGSRNFMNEIRIGDQDFTGEIIFSTIIFSFIIVRTKIYNSLCYTLNKHTRYKPSPSPKSGLKFTAIFEILKSISLNSNKMPHYILTDRISFPYLIVLCQLPWLRTNGERTGGLSE